MAHAVEGQQRGLVRAEERDVAYQHHPGTRRRVIRMRVGVGRLGGGRLRDGVAGAARGLAGARGRAGSAAHARIRERGLIVLQALLVEQRGLDVSHRGHAVPAHGERHGFGHALWGVYYSLPPHVLSERAQQVAHRRLERLPIHRGRVGSGARLAGGGRAAHRASVSAPRSRESAERAPRFRATSARDAVLWTKTRPKITHTPYGRSVIN